MKKNIKRIVSVVLTVLIILMILVAAYFMYCNISGKVPFVANIAFVKILTPSMEPTIPAGSYILAEKTDAGDIKVGDVIMFYSRDAAIYGKINTHRVVEINEENGVRSFITRGDNNPVNDKDPVPEQDVVGKYIRNAGFASKIANFISKPYIFLLIVLIPSVILVGLSIKDVLKKMKEVRMSKLVEAEVEKLKEEKAKEQNCNSDKTNSGENQNTH